MFLFLLYLNSEPIEERLEKKITTRSGDVEMNCSLKEYTKSHHYFREGLIRDIQTVNNGFDITLNANDSDLNYVIEKSKLIISYHKERNGFLKDASIKATFVNGIFREISSDEIGKDDDQTILRIRVQSILQ